MSEWLKERDCKFRQVKLNDGSNPSLPIKNHGDVAQWSERATHNRQVWGFESLRPYKVTLEQGASQWMTNLFDIF